MKKKSAKETSTATQKRTEPVGRPVDQRYVMERLDQSLPLVTDDWQRVEQLLNMITEFAPTSMVMELAGSIANYADDQARRGYVLGQEDLVRELRRRVA
ncbi:MAG: hypothetical protein K2X93_13725 [Candidatus Obscuribacterales bacterium]|nr:hypothetical protein [Candidatus Obscuribacterales bacterium]